MRETEREELERLREQEEKRKAQVKRQNEHLKNACDRMSVAFPKGYKDRIKATGKTVNSFLLEAAERYLQELEHSNE